MDINSVQNLDPSIQSFMDSIRRIVRELRISSRAAEKDVGLSTAQLFILQGLAEEPSLSINDLARKTLTHQSSVSVVVSRLVEAGLLERRPSPSDARQSLISLTQAGKKVLKNAPETAQERLVKGLKKLPQEKRKQLSERLEELIAIVGLQNEPAPLFFEEDKKKSKKAASRR